MKEVKHTPGPWLVTKDYDHRDDVIFAVEVEGGQRVCDLMTDFPEDEANANLIAAAPDMLEALELYALPYSEDELAQLAEMEGGRGEISPTTAKREVIRRHAIAKAKGEA